jgi:hypothetical protein
VTEQAASVKKTKKVAIVIGMVVTSDRLEMTGGTSALKSPSRLTSRGPRMLIGLWPELLWE